MGDLMELNEWSGWWRNMKTESENDETIEIIEVDGIKIRAVLRSDGILSFDTDEFWRLGK